MLTVTVRRLRPTCNLPQLDLIFSIWCHPLQPASRFELWIRRYWYVLSFWSWVCITFTHLQNALRQISLWMTANLLTLNSSKTEYLVCIFFRKEMSLTVPCDVSCMIGLCNNDIFNRIQIHNTDRFRTELAKSVRSLGPKWPRTEVTKDRTGHPVRS